MQMEISVILYNERPPETDIVCPVIALSLPLVSSLRRGWHLVSKAEGRGDIVRANHGPVSQTSIR